MIPAMTHPLGKHWQQPNPRFIRFRNGEAVITRQDFDRLLDYSASTPTGAYEGKMWKCGVPYVKPQQWYLCWYERSDKPGYVRSRSLPMRIIE